MLMQNDSVSSSAMETEEDKKKKKGQKAQGAAGGAASGASVGAMAGPVGALIGAGVGAAAGAVDANQAEKAAASAGPRPKRRRLQAGLDKYQETKDRKERALATLSQAVFDWAASIR